HALEFVGVALLGDKQAGDLTLDARCDHDAARFRQRLYPRRDIGRIAVNLACRIDYYWAYFNPNACVQCWLANSGILAVHLRERALDRERSPYRAFGVVLLRHRKAKQGHQSVA